MKSQEKFWNRVADNTSTKLGDTSFKTIELTQEFLNQSDIVLDFGCGSGSLTYALAPFVQSIFGIDQSDGMINKAKQHFTKQTQENIKFEQVSVFDTALKTGSYDVVIAFNVLHYIEELPMLLARMHALLKPGGLFISATVCLKQKVSLVRIFIYVITKMGIVPKINFNKYSDLKGPISDAGFDILKSKIITKLPEIFIVAEKK